MTSYPSAEPVPEHEFSTPEPEPEIKPKPEPEPEPEPEFTIVYNSTVNSTFPTSFPQPEGIFIGNGTGAPEPETEPEPYGEPEAPSMSQHYMPVVAVIAAVIGTLIILENLIVLVTLLRGKPHQPLSVSLFIGNLAGADLVAGIHLIWFVCFDYFLIKEKPAMYIIVLCGIWLVSVAVSIISLFNFGLHRLKLARSTEIRQQSDRSALIVVVLSWLLPIALFIVPAMAGWNCDNCIGIEYCKKKCSMILFPFTKLYTFILAVFLLTAITGMIGIYVWMLYSVHKKVMTLKKKDKVRRKEEALIKTVAYLLGLLTFCTAPVGILLVIDYSTIDYNECLITSFQILSVISFINSIFNPFIYIWRLPAMKFALRRILGLNDLNPESSSKLLSVISKITMRRIDTPTIQKKPSLSEATRRTCMEQKTSDVL